VDGTKQNDGNFAACTTHDDVVSHVFFLRWILTSTKPKIIIIIIMK
jgi:hypothetical protein